MCALRRPSSALPGIERARGGRRTPGRGPAARRVGRFSRSMRPARRLPAVAAVAAGLLLPAAGAAAQAPGAVVGAFPVPGTISASPESQISLRGRPIDQLGTITVTGSRSGPHSGTLEPHSDGGGASFVLDKPLDGGETVRVRTDLPIASTKAGDYSFKTVTRPKAGLQSDPRATDPKLLQALTGAGRQGAQGRRPGLPLASRPATAAGRGLQALLRRRRAHLHRAEEGLRGQAPGCPERADDHRRLRRARLVRAQRQGQRHRPARAALRGQTGAHLLGRTIGPGHGRGRRADARHLLPPR